MSVAIQYPDDLVRRVHLLWGVGFLSPGGPVEVREIVSDLSLTGRTVLDIGCGTGGPAIVLARDCGAHPVIGIDVQPQLVEQARQYVEGERLSDSITVKLVEPGPLPFGDGTFDVVFSKDAIAHIEHKQALFAEIFRILKPGGAFAASDWLADNAGRGKRELQRLLELWHHTVTMATADQMLSLLEETGFERISSRDRNAWYAERAREELTRIEGPLRQKLIDVASEDIVLDWITIRQAAVEATAAGGLRPTHLRAFKPSRDF